MILYWNKNTVFLGTPEKSHILAIVLVTLILWISMALKSHVAAVLVLQQCLEVGSLRHHWITYTLTSTTGHSINGFITLMVY